MDLQIRKLEAERDKLQEELKALSANGITTGEAARALVDTVESKEDPLVIGGAHGSNTSPWVEEPAAPTCCVIV